MLIKQLTENKGPTNYLDLKKGYAITVGTEHHQETSTVLDFENHVTYKENECGGISMGGHFIITCLYKGKKVKAKGIPYGFFRVQEYLD